MAVHEIILSFGNLIELSRKEHRIFPQPLEWDIYLTTINDFKKDIYSFPKLDGANKRQVLTTPMPRFMWRAIARSDEEQVLDLLFDATDIRQGSFFLRAVEYDSQIPQMVQGLLGDPAFSRNMRRRPDWMVLQWFESQFSSFLVRNKHEPR